MPKLNVFIIWSCLVGGGLAGLPVSAQTNFFPVNITVDAAKPLGELKPIWRFFGADEPNYAYMKDGKKLLGEMGELAPQKVFFRAHHLLTSGDGSYALKWGSTSAYKEDAAGKPVYDWTINDRIFDTYLERGLKPYVQLGFMPKALSSHPQDYPQNPPIKARVLPKGGPTYPPKDYAKWGELAYQWTKHCVEKYGVGEVQQWYWEVWNEPNVNYWAGSHEDYCKLYDFAVDGVRRALPTARVGGPEVAGGAGGKFLGEFLEHCARGTNYVTGQPGSPLDFISFHAKGSPVFTNGHVRMGMARQLENMDNAFAVIAASPEFKHLPVVIGESDPEGGAAFIKPSAVYRPSTMYSSYTAASFPRALELAEKHGVNLTGALTWAFEFEDQPFFEPYRVLASNGIDLPILNVFRMFAKMSGQRLAVNGDGAIPLDEIMKKGVRAQPDVSAQATLAGTKLAVLLWHYHDDDVAGPVAAVTLKISGLALTNGTAKVTQYCIDEKHSNAFVAWKAMGKPQPPSASQFAELQQAGQLAQLAASPPSVKVENQTAALSVNLPRQAVVLILVEWGNSSVN